MKVAPRFLAAAAISAALALAQAPDHPGRGGQPPDETTRIQMRVTFLATRLALTDDQKSKATTLFTDAANAGQDERAAIRTARQSLGDAVKKNDTAAIDQVTGEIGRLSGQLMAIESKAEAAFYALLTPEQQAKYDQGRGPRSGGMDGPGGMGGPGRFRRGPNQ